MLFRSNAITQPLSIGDHPILTYAYTPALGKVESIKWQSSTPSVATIGEKTGEVIVLANGKTTITLTINGVNIATYEINVGTPPQTYLAEWAFNDALGSWTSNNIDNLSVVDGKMTGKITSNTNSYVQMSGLNLDLNESSKIEISLKNTTGATALKIAYRNSNHANFNDASRSKTFTISSNDTTYKTYLFDMGSINSWANNNLTHIRIYPLMNADDATFEIDSIKITE